MSCPSPGDLPDPGIKLMHFLHWQADSLPTQPPEKLQCPSTGGKCHQRLKRCPCSWKGHYSYMSALIPSGRGRWFGLPTSACSDLNVRAACYGCHTHRFQVYSGGNSPQLSDPHTGRLQLGGQSLPCPALCARTKPAWTAFHVFGSEMLSCPCPCPRPAAHMAWRPFTYLSIGLRVK